MRLTPCFKVRGLGFEETLLRTPNPPRISRYHATGCVIVGYDPIQHSLPPHPAPLPDRNVILWHVQASLYRQRRPYDDDNDATMRAVNRDDCSAWEGNARMTRTTSSATRPVPSALSR